MTDIYNKKILIVSSDFSPSGGSEWIAYKTYKLLKDKGYKVFVFASNRQPLFEDNYEYKNFFTEFIGNTKEYLKNPFRYYYNKKAYTDFKNFVNKIHPSIIHLHSFRVTLTSSILKICKNIPTVMTIHDTGIICPAATLMYKGLKICKNKKCMQGQYIDCLYNKCSCGLFEPSLRKTIRAYFFKNQYQKYINKYITPSKALKNVIIDANIGIRSEQIITINNFLSGKELEVFPNYKNNGYFLYIGRLSKEKGVKYLLEAMNDLPREIELHIVGKGSEEENLKQYVKENNLNNVKFLGFKNREEIKEEYQNCIATILPCNWFEIFGMTNVESFINGKPVIASNIGAISEIVEHNKTGLLFEPTNIEQLKECILAYWNNLELVVEHGKNARNKAILEYTENRYLKDLINVYEELVLAESRGNVC